MQNWLGYLLIIAVIYYRFILPQKYTGLLLYTTLLGSRLPYEGIINKKR